MLRYDTGATHGFRTKEAGSGGAPAVKDIKEAVDKLGRTFEEFKKANDQRLEELAKKGHVPADLQEKVDKINEAVTEATKIKQELDKEKARIDELEAMANRLGRQKDGDAPAEVKEHQEAFARFMREKDGDENLRDLERKMLARTLGEKAASTISDPDGGYLVPEAVATAIDRLLTQDSAMRAICTVRSIGAANYKKLVSVGGATAGWVGEKDSRPETKTAELVGLEIPTHELYAQPAATQTLLDDAFVNVAAWLADEVSIAFAELEGDAFINGDGVDKPRGLLGYPMVANSSWAWGKVGYIKTGANGDFAASDPGDALINLVHALKRQLRAGARFLMNDGTCAKVRMLKDADGNYLWRPGLEQGQPDRLLGRPISYDDFMPDIASASYSIAFGNFRRAYLIVDRIGIRTLRDPYTKKPYVLFYTTKRVGGGIQDFQAVKLLRFSA